MVFAKITVYLNQHVDLKKNKTIFMSHSGQKGTKGLKGEKGQKGVKGEKGLKGTLKIFHSRPIQTMSNDNRCFDPLQEKRAKRVSRASKVRLNRIGISSQVSLFS